MTAMKLVALSLAVVAVAEDFTDKPFQWPDMTLNGGRVVQILTSEKTAKPVEWNYPSWYKDHSLRFVQDVPTPPGAEVAGGELVLLEYDVTDKKDAKISPKHNELGLIAKDKSGNELGRYVFSLWPIGNGEKNNRQKPREFKVNGADSLVTQNRAVTSIELSKANTWWGLPKDTKQIHVSNLNKQGYQRALEAVKEYAEAHPYFNDYEITLADGKVKMPAVTGNSFIEHVVEVATHQKAFQDGVGKMGYLALSVDQKKAPKFNAVPTQQVRELMAKDTFKAHYNKDLYIVPAYYDARGNPQATNTKSEVPEEWYVIWTSGVNLRQNYKKAELFRQKVGMKAAGGLNLRQLDAPEGKKKAKKGKKNLLH